jgi:mono/diheme cytochrome c family protein
MPARAVLAFGVVVLVALAMIATPRGDAVRAADAKPNPAHKEYREKIAPLLAKYCFECHSGKKPKGGLALDARKDDPGIDKDRAVWEKVVENLKSGEMPPREKAQPTPAEVDRILAWIDNNLSLLDRNGKRDPGRVTLRRLNRAEYNNTIRDLLALDFHPADDFPADDVGYGFDNIGDVLTLPPLLMERYLAASEKIAARAIVTPEQMKGVKEKFLAAKMETSPQKFPVSGGFCNLFSNGEVFTTVAFPREAEYVFRVRAFGDQAGKEPARMALRVDNRTLKQFDVPVESDAPAVYEFKGKVEAGSKRVAAAFTNDFLDRKATDPKRRDRNLHVEYIEVEGPIGGPPPAPPESHQRVMVRKPSGKGDEEACARAIVENFAARAYRRPATKTEIDRLVKLVGLAQKQGDSFERGIQLAAQAVLTSPHFLFRVEIDPDPKNGEAVHFINDYELASRLSYFLWSTMPDDELFAEAKKGTLRTNAAKQARRMLKDPKARGLVENFAGQWLGLRALRAATPDTGRFPGFDENLRNAMARETEMFFETIMRDDRSVLEFIDADYTFVNERLAKHYGIDGVKGDEFRKVNVVGGQRGGVLTHASVLTATSNPTRTSPVKRGKWILDNILGTPPPPPPPDVPDLTDGKQAELSGSLRQRMEQHRAKTICASCHQRMDPLGFGFENYDAIGAWRTADGKFAIDPSGELPGGKAFKGPAELKTILKTRKDAFARCLAEKMLTYAIGRGLENYDRRAVTGIAGDMAKGEYKFTSLVAAIVESDPFLKRRGQK